eukprot:5164342-Heterocapsa_arctica.AAC.1
MVIARMAEDHAKTVKTVKQRPTAQSSLLLHPGSTGAASPAKSESFANGGCATGVAKAASIQA